MTENALTAVETGTGLNELEIIEFCIRAHNKEHFFGINVLKVQEVLKLLESEITKVPGVPGDVLGIIRIRENIISVIDMKESLYGESSLDGGDMLKMLMHCHMNDVNFGFFVDRVIGIKRIVWDDVVDGSTLVTSVNPENFITGVVREKDHLIQLIDFESVLKKIMPDAQSPRSANLPQLTALAPEANKDVHVLFADDSAVTRNTFKDICEKHNIQCTITKNGKELLDNFDPKQHTCVISDIEMPVMDGLSAIKQLRGQGFQQPVVIFSSLCDTIDSRIIEGLNLSGVIKKPDFSALIEKMTSPELSRAV